MKSYEIRAAKKAGIPLTPVFATEAREGWCQVATEIADYLEHLAQEIPPWKFWIRPGLRLAASLVRTIRDLRCR